MTTELLFKRRLGSQDFIRIFPRSSPDLSDGSWIDLAPNAWDAEIIATDPEEGSETIRIRIFEFDPHDTIKRMFYDIDTELMQP